MKKTNRRSFLKTIAGFFTLPAGLSLAKSKQKTLEKATRKTTQHFSFQYNYEKFNCENLKTNGTFRQWVDSIAKEIERLLAAESNEPDACGFGLKYDVEVKPCEWNPGQKDNVPALAVVIYLGKISSQDIFLANSFSFAKMEWERNCKSPKGLQQLARVRFIDCIWSLYDLIREQVIMMKKFGIDCSKPFPN